MDLKVAWFFGFGDGCPDRAAMNDELGRIFKVHLPSSFGWSLLQVS
jgi:hypothetical protein